MTTQNNEGLRFNEGKNRLDLIPSEWIEGLGWILTFGAKKYADRNWELGMDWSKVEASLRRHDTAFWKGEDKDPESGLLHPYHTAWNALALAYYLEKGIGNDDRSR